MKPNKQNNKNIKHNNKHTDLTDNSFIKNRKPNKNSHYYQGIIKGSACKKLFESCKNDNIIYRSGLEYNFIKWCESSSKVVKWASEPICINYISRLDKKEHRYYPDFFIKDNKGNNYIVEIKPYSQTKPPSPNTLSSSSLYEKQTWIKNNDKWSAAIKFAATQKNTKFIIITEKFFEKIGNVLE